MSNLISRDAERRHMFLMQENVFGVAGPHHLDHLQVVRTDPDKRVGPKFPHKLRATTLFIISRWTIFTSKLGTKKIEMGYNILFQTPPKPVREES